MFITFYKPQQTQLTVLDMLQNFNTLQDVFTNPAPNRAKITVETNLFPSRVYYNYAQLFKDKLFAIINSPEFQRLYSHPGPRSDLYETFHIPKKSGGFREINAPKPELMNLLRKIKQAFEESNILEHEQAYAYVKNRTCKHALELHQKNNSKWFLKLDLKDFFGSCTKAFCLSTLSFIYPFCCFETVSEKTCLEMIIDIATLNGALPQGTPLSPLLTNILMTPYDYFIQRYCIRNKFIYTRYADDMLISSQLNFNWQQVQNDIKDCLPAQLIINTAKTRYGSSAGQNWNLGLMLNKDNKITLGHKHKERLKAAIFSFLKDFTTGNYWSIIDTQRLQGDIAYQKNIEPQYAANIIRKLETKTNQNLKHAIKQILQ